MKARSPFSVPCSDLLSVFRLSSSLSLSFSRALYVPPLRSPFSYSPRLHFFTILSRGSACGEEFGRSSWTRPLHSCAVGRASAVFFLAFERSQGGSTSIFGARSESARAPSSRSGCPDAQGLRRKRSAWKRSGGRVGRVRFMFVWRAARPRHFSSLSKGVQQVSPPFGGLGSGRARSQNALLPNFSFRCLDARG